MIVQRNEIQSVQIIYPTEEYFRVRDQVIGKENCDLGVCADCLDRYGGDKHRNGCKAYPITSDDPLEIAEMHYNCLTDLAYCLARYFVGCVALVLYQIC